MSDLYGTCRGVSVYLEVKKSKADAKKNTPTVIRQRYFLDKMSRVGAFCAFIYPENEEEIMNILKSFPLITEYKFKVL